jgi:hypothetical protein
MFSKYPKDLYIRNHFYKSQREYNKTRKQAYRQYKKSLLNQLETLHSDNSKLYWSHELTESKSCDEKSSAVDSSAWVSHFRNLSEIDDK